jgi:hypothetical protein
VGWGKMPRGSDFQARWTEGYWAETRILAALNAHPSLLAVQFGITDGTAFWSAREMAARQLPNQTRHGKRPDILVFRKSDLSLLERAAAKKLLLKDDQHAEPLARRAILAIESEFSPYAYKHRLAEYGAELSFTIKDEDLQPLRKWQRRFGVPLGIVQCYLDSSYFLPFKTLLNGIRSGSIRKQIERSYNKPVYYPRMSTGISFATFSNQPKIAAVVILDKYGKYTAIREVTGGILKLTPEMRNLVR